MTSLTPEQHLANRRERHRARIADEFPTVPLADRINDAENFWRLTLVPKHGYDNTYEPPNVEFGRMMTHRGHTFLSKRHMMGVTVDDRGIQAYAFGLGSMLTAQRVSKTPAIEVKDGDVFEFVVDGQYVHFLAVWRRNEYLYLFRINPDGSIEPRFERNGEPAYYG